MNTHRHGPPRAAPRRITACAAAVALLVAGCTSTTADDPTTATASKSSTAPTPSVVDVSPIASLPVSPSSDLTSSEPSTKPTETSGSLDPATQDAADRAAIEAQWAAFWSVYNGIVRTPTDQRSSVLSTVAVDPILSEILGAADRFDSQGLDYYGSVVQHPYWVTPVSGQPFAVMRDCQDQSGYGSLYTSTGVKRSVGIDRNSIQAGFIKLKFRSFEGVEQRICGITERM